MVDITFSGTVTPYEGNGRKLGYPTANIDAPADAPEGVFAGFVTMRGKRLPAMIFIGEPVTLDDFVRRAEAHIFDIADRDLYGEELIFQLEKLMRENRKFDSVEDLVKQMKQDELEIRQYLKI